MSCITIPIVFFFLNAVGSRSLVVVVCSAGLLLNSLSLRPIFSKVGRLQEGFPELHGAALQLVGEALCGGATALRLHLQQRQGPGGAGRPQPLHGSGGVQRRPAGHAQGASLLHSLTLKQSSPPASDRWVAARDVWADKYLFLFVSDGQHLCRVHKTPRHSPAGHQREGHERLAVRLQPAARRHDKVSFARPSAQSTTVRPHVENSKPNQTAVCRHRSKLARRRSGMPKN